MRPEARHQGEIHAVAEAGAEAAADEDESNMQEWRHGWQAALVGRADRPESDPSLEFAFTMTQPAPAVSW